MSKIRIRNFGPIKDGYQENDGWLDISKVTVFIGNQGSGKSTVAKLFSTMTWVEKAFNRGDIEFRDGIDAVNQIAWQGLESYLSDNSEIEYIGERYSISYKPNEQSGPIVVPINDAGYIVPKIMYVPAERNFLSTIKDAFDVSSLPGALAEFAEELKRAQFELSGSSLELPFKNFSYEYDQKTDSSFVTGKDYSVNLLDASSGLQSLIPLYLVSRNLSMKIASENDPSTAEVSANQSVRRDREISKIMADKTLTSEEKSRRAAEEFSKYHSKCFINIVEEPEQNLFPTSQRSTLNSLVKFNANKGNKLIMTTHSPYLINYLTLAVKANQLLKMASGKQEEAIAKINKIVPLGSDIDADDLAIYEINESGSIIRLGNYKGIPADDNYLNYEMGETNELFAQLLEIQQQL